MLILFYSQFMKKHKKTNKANACVNPIKSLEITKTYFDHYSSVARKMFKLLDLNPDLFDCFTKKQKLNMMKVKFEIPKISIKKGHDVPRQYLRLIQHETYRYLRENYVGDPSIGLLHEDYITIGMSFISKMSQLKTNPVNLPEQMQQQVSEKVEAFISSKGCIIGDYLIIIQMITLHITKFNFRVYGFLWDGWTVSEKDFSMTCPIFITSTHSQQINFNYWKVHHTAYRLGIGTNMIDSPVWVKTSSSSIDTNDSNDRSLSVYIQSHALARIKERLDIMAAYTQRISLFNSVLDCKLVTTFKGSTLISFRDEHERILGYIPFTIDGDNLILLSFLPLCSPNVPEGIHLCKILDMTKDDLIFLGMDKLSFYQNTDFDANPRLKVALKKAGMWHLTEIVSEESAHLKSSVQNKGLIAKFFLQSPPVYNGEEILQEIAEIY